MTRPTFTSYAIFAAVLSLVSGCSSGEGDASSAGAGGGPGGQAGAAGSGGQVETGGSAGSNEGGTGGGSGGAGGAVSETCAALHAGMNDGFVVDGLGRSFILTLPDNIETGGPFPVVFNWHGLGDTAANMSALVAGQVNRTDFPFIAVTPEDSNFTVSAMGMTVTMDWDVLNVPDGNTNREVRLFDEVTACLEARYSVDPSHVHSMGFSIGGIVSDLLGVVRGARVASIATYSGGYFSTKENVDSLGVLQAVGISWPQPGPEAYPQLILYGGDTDSWSPGAGVQVKFDVFANNDTNALNKAGHDVVLCNHGKGHTAPPPDMPGSAVLEFFRDHPLGTSASPYRAGGLPADFATYCKLKEGK